MRKLLVVFLFLRLTSWSQDVDLSASANNYRFDSQIWAKAKATLPLNKKTEISAQYISRIYLDGTTNPGSYFYLSGKRSLKKWLAADFTTRFVIDQGYNMYRLEAGLKVKKNVKDFQFAFRTAGFLENRTIAFTNVLSRSTYYFWRNRVEASWSPKKKWEFGASFETWNVFNYRYNGKLDKACVTVDAEYKLTKHHALTLAYQNQFDIQKAHKTSLNMYVLGYEYTFKRLNEKKKNQH
ncbi:hypothetical protein [Fluviicola sp.]|uniref:DUF2490 domain-containing protein n=1 Tax=Fluviicola sp. TaxID=1917219 RepID=UPI0031DD732F